MKLEIRNLSSQATYEIDPDGAVLGREGSKADIVLRDQAVSKKHAKIYEKNGRWYLEDLASSNGTFVDNRRITEPVILTPGAVFALSENQFEVVQIINGSSNGKAAFDREGGDSRDAPYQDALDDLPPLGMISGDESQDGKRSPRSMRNNQSARGASPAQAGADPADDMPPPGADQKGVGYFFIAVPKAIAYYLAAIPLMALNPVGTIRKGIEEQRFPAMGPMQLIAYAIPAQLFQQLLGVITAVIASLIAGAFLLPIVPLITAIVVGLVVSVITGFIFHPVFRWIIKFLKGESDDKSRTNYFIAMNTAAALTAIPSSLGVILAMIHVPFISILPVVITLAASLITFFVFYSWMKYFNVVAWFQKVLMVIGVLILLGAGYNLVMAILGSISALGSGGSTAVAAANAANAANDANLTAEQREAMKASQEALAKAMAASGSDAEAVKKAQEAAAKAVAEAQANAAKAAEDAAKAGNLTAEQQEAIKKAQEAAAAAMKGGEKAAQEGQAAVAAAAKAAEDAKSKAQEAADRAAREREEKREKEREKELAREKEREAAKKGGGGEEEGAGAEEGGEKPNLAGVSNQFQDFLTKRTACEAAIEKDPTLLKKKDVLAAYEKYLKKTFEVRGKWAKKKAKDPATQKINDRLKDIEVYESTSKMVSELYGKIFH